MPARAWCGISGDGDVRYWPEPAVHRSAALRQLSERNPTLGGGGQYRRS
jgi:hypothetical protein